MQISFSYTYATKVVDKNNVDDNIKSIDPNVVKVCVALLDEICSIKRRNNNDIDFRLKSVEYRPQTLRFVSRDN